MNYAKISEGYVTQRELDTSTSTVACPRCVLGPDGEIICTFTAQSRLGSNDFKPMIARSRDGGASWSAASLIWPDLADRYSLFGSISKAPSGEFLFFGTRTLIDSPGEGFWSEETQGLKANDLFWSRSKDGGRTWSDLMTIPMPVEGSAEAPGAMCATRNGHLVCCYAPYRTFDPHLTVTTNRLICLFSRDQGQSWKHSEMLKFPDPESSGAEAWVIELADGRMLGTSWHIRGEESLPDVYAISHDSGASWSATASTGILGQATALAPLQDGEAIFLFNQRKSNAIGVWLARIKPTERDFGIHHMQRAWAAERASQMAGSTDHKNWTNFAFGEPSALVLPDGDILVTLWSLQRPAGDIVYVKLREADRL